MSKRKKYKIYDLFICIFFFVLVFFVQKLGYMATDKTLDLWYRTLNLPIFTPPNWVFTPVWTGLYISIALSGFLFWESPKLNFKKLTLFFWVAQLFFNALWSFTFFYFMQPIYGAIDIFIVIFFVIGLMFFGWKVSKAAVYILIPYLLWLIYAAAINVAIVYLN